jgi:transposase
LPIRWDEWGVLAIVTALEALLPDRWLAAHPEHRLEQREEESREAQARRRRKRAARRAVPASQEMATS